MSSRWISISASAPGALGPASLTAACDRLDQRALAGAARAPQQHVVGREPGREPLGVVEQNVAHPVDPAQQTDRHPVDRRHRFQPFAVGMPDEGVGGIEIVDRGGVGASRSSASAMRCQ